MRTTVLAVIALVLMSSSAQAKCFSVPDDIDSGFVANSTAHTVCLNQDLSDDTDRKANDVRWQRELDAMRMQMLSLQRKQQMQLQMMQLQQAHTFGQ